MRVLLDACVPRGLLGAIAKLAPELSLRHALDLGWGDLDDGPLLDRAAGVCDVFVTVDRKLQYQQRLAQRPFAVVVLRAPTNRIQELAPLVPALLSELPAVTRGSVRSVPV